MDISARVRTRCKTGLAMSRIGTTVHQVTGASAVFRDGKAEYKARFRCGDSSSDVILLASADEYGGICKRCLDVADGPAIYRCYNAAGDLLYIGTTSYRRIRMAQHAAKSRWWPEVTDVQFQDMRTFSDALVAERLAILAERPTHNHQFKVRA